MLSHSFPEVLKSLEVNEAPLLILDDNYDNAETLSQQLSLEGYVVLKAKTAEEALSYIKDANISVIITYHKPQGASGINVLFEAKKIRPYVEQIVIAPRGLTETLLEQLGAVHLFVEAYDAKPFAKTVKEAFQKFKLRYDYQNLSKMLDAHQGALNEAYVKERSELEFSSKIHQTLLLDPSPKEFAGVKIASLGCCSTEIDGDFISFFSPSKDLLDIAIGDVMGKGLQSALVATWAKSELRRFALPEAPMSYHYDHFHFWQEDIAPIKNILQNLHKESVPRLMDWEFFISLFYGRLDIRKRTFSFIDCGFTQPLYYRKKTGKASLIPYNHFPLGTVVEHEYSPFEISLEEDDVLIFYSDGIIQSLSPQGEPFSSQRLLSLIEEYADLAPEDLKELIKQHIVQFTGSNLLEDDLTLVILKIDKWTLPTSNTQRLAKFNSVLSQLDAARKWIQEICEKGVGDTDRLVLTLQLAMDEIFTNIVIHGYEGKSGGPIYIRSEYLMDKIMIEISDQGRSFEPFNIPDVNLFGDRDHGYGWYLIQQIADGIEYIPKKNQAGWNHLKIYKNYFSRRGASMEMSSKIEKNVLIIQLESSTLDAKQVSEFKEKALHLINQHQTDQVVFDLQNLQFIDSSGLGAFLSLFRQLNTRGGHLALAAMSKPVKTIFQLVSMQKIFNCYPSVEEAIKSMPELRPKSP